MLWLRLGIAHQPGHVEAEGIGEGGEQRQHRAEAEARPARLQHDHHADKPDEDRGPAPGADTLAQHGNRERAHEQGAHEGDGHGIGQRKEPQGGDEGHGRRGADDAPQQVPSHPACAQGEEPALAHRQRDGEEGPHDAGEEHDLGQRIAARPAAWRRRRPPTCRRRRDPYRPGPGAGKLRRICPALARRLIRRPCGARGPAWPRAARYRCCWRRCRPPRPGPASSECRRRRRSPSASPRRC